MPQFQKGRRYRIEYLPAGARTKTRTVEVNFVGHKQDEPAYLLFDGRPEFGDASLHQEQIVKVEDLGAASYVRR
jgi:hypothetical protein